MITGLTDDEVREFWLVNAAIQVSHMETDIQHTWLGLYEDDDPKKIVAESLLNRFICANNLIKKTAWDMLSTGLADSGGIVYTPGYDSNQSTATLTLDEVKAAIDSLPEPEPFPPMVVNEEELNEALSGIEFGLWSPYEVLRSELLPEGCVIVMGCKEAGEFNKKAREWGLGLDDVLLGHVLARQYSEDLSND